nr:hypothetical protein [Streptomyces sp. DHE17-7]
MAGQHETPEVSAPGAAPILVVGNTGDPARPTRAPAGWRTNWARTSAWCSPGRARATVRTGAAATVSTRRSTPTC